jgi:hypothetical protein
MRIKLIARASELSLLLCITTVILWVRSYGVEDSLWVGTAPRPTSHGYRGIVHWEFRLGHGGIYAERAFHESQNDSYLASVSQSGSDSETGDTGQLPPPRIHTTYGFEFNREEWKDCLREYRLLYVVVPLWCPILLTAVMPISRYFSRLCNSWVHHNSPFLCQRCAYNLTGNTSGVCPECGTAVPIKITG